MNFSEAIHILAKVINERKLIEIVNAEVEPLCKTPTYNNENTDEHTHLYDWLAEGNYSGKETPQSLADEWDSYHESESK